MSDYYTESQMQRIEQAAYDGATLEAGKEWERQRYEFGATEAELAARIAELEAEVTKCHELQDSYCDRIAELEAENDQLTAHDATERQDDKSSNDTQTQTIVYGKEDSEVQE